MTQMAATLAPWLTLALVGALAAVALAMLAARSLFAVSVMAAALAALAAAVLMSAGGGDGAIALAAFGVGLAPVLVLAGVLLSARAVKSGKRRLPLLHVLAMAGGVAAIAAIAPELTADAPVLRAVPGSGVWLAALVFVAAVACIGLLGYGERGVLERGPKVGEP